jgi:hypothetical protein
MRSIFGKTTEIGDRVIAIDAANGDKIDYDAI